jgi:hypothetical protein
MRYPLKRAHVWNVRTRIVLLKLTTCAAIVAAVTFLLMPVELCFVETQAYVVEGKHHARTPGEGVRR